jgi:hypothetical protein
MRFSRTAPFKQRYTNKQVKRNAFSRNCRVILPQFSRESRGVSSLIARCSAESPSCKVDGSCQNDGAGARMMPLAAGDNGPGGDGLGALPAA